LARSIATRRVISIQRRSQTLLPLFQFEDDLGDASR
jgi:hypothetical protein